MKVGVNQVAKFAMNNKGFLEISNKLGCFNCCNTFEKDDIKKWTDSGKTAICPLCQVDCVVGDSCGYEINEESLKKAHNYWLKKD